MNINQENSLRTRQRTTFRKLLVASSVLLLVITITIIAVQIHQPEKSLAAGCDVDYSLSWSDPTTYNVTCGTVNSGNWSVKGNTCTFTSPDVYSNGNPGDPDKEVVIAIRVNQSGNLDGNDTTWVRMYTDGVLRRNFMVKGDSVSKVFSVTQWVPIKADGYFKIEVVCKNDKTNELWQIKDGDVTACIRTLNPLPINLSEFSATPDVKNNIIVNWSTMAEVNNEYFSLERSSDGTVFEEINKQEGAGNSNSLIRYSYTDKKPFADINYYRLRQVDYDGQSTTSKIIKVNVSKKGKTREPISIFPNPAKDATTIEFQSDHSEQVSVMFTSQSGKVISTEVFNAIQGNNTIQYQFPSNIKPGSYNIRVATKNELIGSEIVIVK